MELNEKTINTNRQLIYWQLALSPLIYLVMCELLIKYVFKAGQTGFVPLPAVQYGMIKTGLIILAAIEAGFILSIRMCIHSGNLTWPGSMILKPYVGRKGNEYAIEQGFMIMILAICVSISVYGLTLFFLNGIRLDAYAFMGVSQALTLLFMPTKVYTDKFRALKSSAVNK